MAGGRQNVLKWRLMSEAFRNRGRPPIRWRDNIKRMHETGFRVDEIEGRVKCYKLCKMLRSDQEQSITRFIYNLHFSEPLVDGFLANVYCRFL